MIDESHAYCGSSASSESNPEQRGSEQHVAPNKIMKVTRQTIVGAMDDPRESIITSTHCFVTGPSAIGLEIPKSGFQQAPEHSIPSSRVLKKLKPSAPNLFCVSLAVVAVHLAFKFLL